MRPRSRWGVTPVSTPTIIPNGIDVPYWRAQPSPRYLRPGMRNLVYLGRLEERNGPDLAIEAFTKIAAAVPTCPAAHGGRRPDARFPASQGSTSSPTAGRVPGASQRDRPELLASSSVFLLPARAVSFSIMVLESFAAGLPVVALPALGTDRAGYHCSSLSLPKTPAQMRLRMRCSKPSSASRARSSSAARPSRSLPTGPRLAAGSSTCSNAWSRHVLICCVRYPRPPHSDGNNK